MTLEVTLFGTARVRFAGETLAMVGKPLALLCRLALGAVPRRQAAELLWGEYGAKNLRQALVTLRKLPGATHWLEDGEPLHVRAATDVGAFEAALERGDLEGALAAHGGQLLETVAVDSPAWREWLDAERARLAALHLGALRTHAAMLEERDPERALALWSRVFEADGLDEGALQAAMRLEIALGRRYAAQARLSAFRRAVREGLNADASGETLALLTTATSGEQDLRSRLACVRSFAPALRDDYAFLGAVLETDALNLAENAAVDVEVATVPDAVRDFLRERTAHVLEARFEASAPDALEAAAQIARLWLAVERTALNATRWWMEVARQAQRRGVLKVAVDGFYRALWLSGDDDARLEALLGLGGVAEGIGDVALMDCVARELERLGRIRQDDRTLFHAAHRLGSWQMRVGQPLAAVDQGLEALGIARRLDDRALEELAYGLLGTARLATGDLHGARAALLHLTESANVQLQLRGHANLGSIEGMLGHLDAALEHMERALTVSRALQLLSVTASILFNLGATALKGGRLGRAEAGFREAIALGERIGNTGLTAQATLALANVHTQQGRLGLAWNTANDALALVEGNAPLEVQAVVLLGELEARCQRFDAARTELERARSLYGAMGNERGALGVDAALALVGVRRGDAGAEANTRAALERLRDAGHVDQFDSLRLEYALLTRDAESLTWALEGLTVASTGVTVARARLYVDAEEAVALEAMLDAGCAHDEYGECLTGYALLLHRAPVHDRDGLRAKLEAARAAMAAGLPKAQRQAFLEGVIHADRLVLETPA
jgi:DNA-binding SARP family transcriptional activator/tetratricopeptide (TPR) repeat protein